MALWLDDLWVEVGRPDPFVVVEGGAGRGRLCRDVMLSVEDCRDAIRYVMVERSDVQRAEALERVAAECFAGSEEIPVAAIAALPAGPFTGAVIANELLDNLPPRIVERSASGWDEIHVDGDRFVRRPAPQDAAKMASALAPDSPPGGWVPLQLKAAVWVRRALGTLARGRVLLLGYGPAPPAALAKRPAGEWLRTYRSHRRASDVLASPGSQDITCDVAFDQLPSPRSMRTQSDWLRDHGLDDLTADASRRWNEAAAAPNAADVAARAVLDEAQALTATGGLGDFLVAEWQV